MQRNQAASQTQRRKAHHLTVPDTLPPSAQTMDVRNARSGWRAASGSGRRADGPTLSLVATAADLRKADIKLIKAGLQNFVGFGGSTQTLDGTSSPTLNILALVGARTVARVQRRGPALLGACKYSHSTRNRAPRARRPQALTIVAKLLNMPL